MCFLVLTLKITAFKEPLLLILISLVFYHKTNGRSQKRKHFVHILLLTIELNFNNPKTGVQTNYMAKLKHRNKTQYKTLDFIYLYQSTFVNEKTF